MLKNKSVMGFDNFLVEFYRDLKSGLAGEWWNESYNRRQDLISYSEDIKTTNDAVEYVRNNFKDIPMSEIKSIINQALKANLLLSRRRVYLWQVDDSLKDSQEVIVEENEVESLQQEEKSEQEQERQEEKVKTVKPVPDFEIAKSFDGDKEALKKYAEKFDIKLDGRKDFDKMVKSFQGKYHATKGK